jgi:hypothetical protein
MKYFNRISKKYALLSSISDLSIRLWPFYFFAIFQPTVFKFRILRENYLRSDNTAGFLDPLPSNSGTELSLGLSHEFPNFFVYNYAKILLLEIEF